MNIYKSFITVITADKGDNNRTQSRTPCKGMG